MKGVRGYRPLEGGKGGERLVLAGKGAVKEKNRNNATVQRI